MNGEASRSKNQQICSRKNIRTVPSPTTSPIYGQTKLPGQEQSQRDGISIRKYEERRVCLMRFNCKLQVNCMHLVVTAFPTFFQATVLVYLACTLAAHHLCKTAV